MTSRGPRRWVLFGVALLVNLAVLFWPSGVGGGGPDHGDKLVHALSFAAVAWTGVGAGLPVAVLGAALAVHGVASEVVQAALLPDRSGDPWDVVADLAGVAVGAGAASWRDGGVGGRRRGRNAARGQPDPG